MRWLATIQYDGTRYAGWQLQPDHLTVQQVMEEAVARVTSETPRVHASGRTDAGVHAKGQRAHFDLHKASADRSRLTRSLNAVLPDDVRVADLQPVTDDFHARFDAVAKEYRYFVWNDRWTPPELRLYRHRVNSKLDVEAMTAAAAVFLGKHDFASFTANPNREVETTARTITQFDIFARRPDIEFRVRGNGFLYRMVRSLIGCLLDVGLGKLSTDDVNRLLQAAERTRKVKTAPAKGLFLWEVWYADQESEWFL